MKKLFILLFAVAPIVVFAQRKPKIKGSRIVTQVSEELPPFNAVVLNDDLEINLKKGLGPGFYISADDNLVDILKFEVVDETLIISSYYTITAKKELEITVNYTGLKALTVKNGTIVSQDVIDTDDLFIDAFNNTRLDIKANASVMDINLEDTSNADFHVEADSLNIHMNKRAQSYVYAQTNSGLLDLEGHSSLTMEGTSDQMQANFMGDSKYKGETMEIGALQLQISGQANARVYAFREVTIGAVDNSSIYLYGQPKITVDQFTGTVQLIKKE